MVEKVKHVKSGTILAVKVRNWAITLNTFEQLFNKTTELFPSVIQLLGLTLVFQISAYHSDR